VSRRCRFCLEVVTECVCDDLDDGFGGDESSDEEDAAG